MHGHGGGHGHGHRPHHHGPQPINIHLLPWHWITNLLKNVLFLLAIFLLWYWIGAWGIAALVFGPIMLWAFCKAIQEEYQREPIPWVAKLIKWMKQP